MHSSSHYSLAGWFLERYHPSRVILQKVTCLYRRVGPYRILQMFKQTKEIRVTRATLQGNPTWKGHLHFTSDNELLPSPARPLETALLPPKCPRYAPCYFSFVFQRLFLIELSRLTQKLAGASRRCSQAPCWLPSSLFLLYFFIAEKELLYNFEGGL